jgi:hypothetical protein
MTNGTSREWGVSVRLRSIFTLGKDPVPIIQKAGWALGPVWTGAENLAPTGIRSPDHPVAIDDWATGPTQREYHEHIQHTGLILLLCTNPSATNHTSLNSREFYYTLDMNERLSDYFTQLWNRWWWAGEAWNMQGLKYRDITVILTKSVQMSGHVVVVYNGVLYLDSVNRKKKMNRTELRLGGQHERNCK